MFLDVRTALPYLKAGQLRALAVASGQRSSALPDVPTIAESGYPGFDVPAWYGLVIKSGTPPTIVDKLYSEVKKALDSPDVIESFRSQGIEPGGLSPTDFAAEIKRELAYWTETIKRLNIAIK
jgi:tripartite-type tricarboxylate transporter receptor subunit TctC